MGKENSGNTKTVKTNPMKQILPPKMPTKEHRDGADQKPKRKGEHINGK